MSCTHLKKSNNSWRVENIPLNLASIQQLLSLDTVFIEHILYHTAGHIHRRGLVICLRLTADVVKYLAHQGHSQGGVLRAKSGQIEHGLLSECEN